MSKELISNIIIRSWGFIINIKVNKQIKELDILILHGRNLNVVNFFIRLFKSLGITSDIVKNLPTPRHIHLMDDKVGYYYKECKVALILATFDEEKKGSTRARINIYNEIGRSYQYKEKTIIIREIKNGKEVELGSNVEGIPYISFEKKSIHEALPILITELRSRGFCGGEKKDASGSDESNTKVMVPEKPEIPSIVDIPERVLEVSPDKDIRIQMVKIPPDTFKMGDDKTGRVKVTISRPFLIDIYLVTQGLYQKVMKKNPSYFKGKNLPVENISWLDAIKFCNELSKKYNLEPVYDIKGKEVEINLDRNGFRLPTEAEWEYACCRKTTKKRYEELDNIAWYIKNSEKHTQDVGQKNPNKFGLYDMLGNVWEWCNDYWHSRKYLRGPLKDPIGLVKSDYRILRGGSWANPKDIIRSTYRIRQLPFTHENNRGFRLVRSLNQQAA